MRTSYLITPLAMAMALLLSSCATTPEQPVLRETRLKNAKSSLSSYAKVAEEEHNHIHIFAGHDWEVGEKSDKAKYPSKYLRIINPADNSKVVAAKVAMVIFGGQVTGHSKHDLKGSATDVENQSLQAAFMPVRDYLFKEFGSNANGGDYFPFMILGERFYLVYDSYSGSKETTRLYELVEKIRFRKIREDVGETSATFRQFNYVCEQNGVKHTLKEWEANNYQLVHDTAKQYAQNCANDLITKQKADLHAAFIR